MTTQTESTSLTAKTLNWIKQQLSSKLPLSGGTMTGKLRLNDSAWVLSDTDSSSCIYGGATDPTTGAYLHVYGKDGEDKGAFFLNAKDGTNSSTLTGRPTGTLTFNGQHILRSVNGHVAGSDGNVELVYLRPNSTFGRQDDRYEGGQFFMQRPLASTVISGDVTVDAYENSYRVIAVGASGAVLGAIIDFTQLSTISKFSTENSAGNTYIKYDTGVLICWGDGTAGKTTQYISFPTPFGGTNYAVAATICGASSTTGLQINIVRSASSYFGVTGSGGYSFNWIAIGRWK